MYCKKSVVAIHGEKNRTSVRLKTEKKKKKKMWTSIFFLALIFKTVLVFLFPFFLRFLLLFSGGNSKTEQRHGCDCGRGGKQEWVIVRVLHQDGAEVAPKKPRGKLREDYGTRRGGKGYMVLVVRFTLLHFGLRWLHLFGVLFFLCLVVFISRFLTLCVIGHYGSFFLFYIHI